MPKSWYELFKTNDPAIYPRISAIHKKAYDLAHANDDKKLAGPDETAKQLEALLIKELARELTKKEFLNNKCINNFTDLLRNWEPVTPTDEPGLELGYKCAIVQNVLYAAVITLHNATRVDQYQKACKKYAEALKPDQKELLKVVNDLSAILSNSDLDPENKIANFHVKLREAKPIFHTQSNSEKFLQFVKGLGVFAATILGLGVGGILAYHQLFKKEIARDTLYKGLPEEESKPSSTTNKFRP